MATATYNATPPSLSSCNNNYRAWKKLIKHWQNLCSLSKPNRASAILLTLSGKALNAALQIPEEDLAKDDGVETLLKQLDTLYIKDELSEKFKALEAFETYRRPSSSSIRDFLIEFENKHFKIKEFKVTTDDLLGFRLIKAANLSPDKEELIKATVTELTYNEVKTKMSKYFLMNHEYQHLVLQCLPLSNRKPLPLHRSMFKMMMNLSQIQTRKRPTMPTTDTIRDHRVGKSNLILDATQDHQMRDRLF